MILERGGGGQEGEEYICWPPLPFFFLRDNKSIPYMLHLSSQKMYEAHMYSEQRGSFSKVRESETRIRYGHGMLITKLPPKARDSKLLSSKIEYMYITSVQYIYTAHLSATH